MHARTLLVAVTGLATAATGLVGVAASAAGPSLAVNAITRSGQPAETLAYAMNLATGKKIQINTGDRTALPRGRYAVGAYITDNSALTVAARVVNVTKASTVTFDTGKARKVELKVDDTSVRPSALAVVPFATVKGKLKTFIGDNGIQWPAEGTYVLPAKDKALSLGVHGALTKPGDGPSPVRYDLAKVFTGLPGDASLSGRKAALARVNMNVSVIDEDHSAFLRLVPARANLKPLTGSEVGRPILGNQVSYRTPGLQWHSQVSMSGLNGFSNMTEKFKRKGKKKFLYAAGKTYKESWGNGVWGPRANSPAIFNQGGRVQVRGGQPLCSNALVGVTLDDCQFQPVSFSYRLNKAGTVLASGEAVSAPLPAKPTWYTATLTAQRDDNGADLMKTLKARWYFRAGGPGPTGPLNAGTLQITPAGLDARHFTAAASTSVGVAVGQLKGVRSVVVEYSTNGGKTWKKAKVTGKGAKWTGKVANPGKGLMSLRVTATARSGASVSYTVTDAYGVK